ncbi:LytR C-terminal domain-containing protein [Phycicoccus sp.]|uniref:LytR C-terminal domain-containing protein n=1 Tax=Phycicoccus sp. TaxID=1902410 RepID=UPI002CBBAB35|nr:LytR C-terminal domain-containing protein [Phycicoccus sp.]HMM96205.1 LytR C-terminal domain-containing protein [Phycicoccus sp.]
MSEYTSESPASVEARRRRRRSVVVIGVVLLALFFAFWYGLSYYRADENARASKPPPPTCRPYDAAARTPEQVTVNVFNATTRPGLAGKTAVQLRQDGFLIGLVANDPTKRRPPKVAEVRYGPTGKPDAQLLLKVLPKGSTSTMDTRKDATVDVALGAGFKALVPYVVASDQLPMCPQPSSS